MLVECLVLSQRNRWPVAPRSAGAAAGGRHMRLRWGRGPYVESRRLGGRAVSVCGVARVVWATYIGSSGLRTPFAPFRRTCV
jgi:hypothetical protein